MKVLILGIDGQMNPDLISRLRTISGHVFDFIIMLDREPGNDYSRDFEMFSIKEVGAEAEFVQSGIFSTLISTEFVLDYDLVIVITDFSRKLDSSYFDKFEVISRLASRLDSTPLVLVKGMNSTFELSKIEEMFSETFDSIIEESTLFSEFYRVASIALVSKKNKKKKIEKVRSFSLANTFDGLVAIDASRKILFWNQAMERMFGIRERDVLGKEFSNLILQGAIDSLEAEIEMAFEGSSFVGELISLELRGEVKVYQPYFSSMRSDEGSVICVAVSFRDITELTDCESKLKDLSDRFAQLACSIPGMVWMSDSSGSRTFFSRSWVEYTGIDANALTFDGWLVAMHPQDRQRYSTSIVKALEERRTFHVEYRIRRQDNVYRRMLDSGSPIIGADGSFRGFLGACTEIGISGTTHHRLSPVFLQNDNSITGIDTRPDLSIVLTGGVVDDTADDKADNKADNDSLNLRSIESSDAIKSSGSRVNHKGDDRSSQLRDLRSSMETSTMEHAPIGLWKLDRSFVIVKASPAAASQMGLNSSELVGLDFCQVVKSVPREKLVLALKGDSTVQISRHKVELHNDTSESSAYFDIAAWPLKNRDGSVQGIYVSTIEVQGAELDKRKEDFVATLVHDLKTPLIGADRTLELILNGTLGEVDEGQSEVLSMLKRSNQSLLRMVQNLIEVYRYDYSEPHLAFEPVSMFNVAAECSRELEAVADSKGLRLEIALSSGKGHVHADSLALKRVISNLIDNALKFTGRGGVIKIWGEETPNKVTVHVRDNGIGIVADEMQRVFERFWRSKRHSGQSVGTGLGLYLCKQIVNAHEGEIHVSSVLGEGTQFSVTLPRQ